MPMRRSDPAKTSGDATPLFGVGLVGSTHAGSGLAMRYYAGENALQVNLFSAIREKGSSVFWGGLGWSRVFHRWGKRRQRRRLMPASLGLRGVAGLSYLWQRDVSTSSEWDDVAKAFNIKTKNKRSQTLYGGAGIGLQFGALYQPGLALGLDLVMTAKYEESKLKSLLPLPAADIMYSW